MLIKYNKSCTKTKTKHMV